MCSASTAWLLVAAIHYDEQVAINSNAGGFNAPRRKWGTENRRKRSIRRNRESGNSVAPLVNDIEEAVVACDHDFLIVIVRAQAEAG
jgi:hypothetical protein